MAVQSSLLSTSMSVRYKAGIDVSGKDIIKAKKYPNVKVNANSDDLLFVGASLGSLMKYDFVDVLRSDESALFNA